ncbi:hypothetical protein VTI74DRAFT_5900 [Chaetomium olivicolor]
MGEVPGDARPKSQAEAQQQGDVYWPADLVRHTVPDSRVLTFGYDTQLRHRVVGPVSENDISDYAWNLLCCLEAQRRHLNEKCRPILFVAHSLGGIVVKEALRRSRACESSKAHIHAVFEATVGILFFGTPHRGADPRGRFLRVLSVSAQALGIRVNQHVVNALTPNSKFLKALRDEFSLMWHEKKWPVYSFQEEYAVVSLFFARKVVEDHSSYLDNLALETRQSISSNHMDMCRFSGLQDPEYLKVAAAMSHILREHNRRNNPGELVSEIEVPDVMHIESETSSLEELAQDTISLSRIQERTGHSQNANCSLPDGIVEAIVDQLYFAKIDVRLVNLSAAQPKTCRWFLQNDEWIDWRDPDMQSFHGGFLWIKGNPGTGKSTLMKFLFEEVKLSSAGDASQVILSFFFLARGTAEEKSTNGLYRSLLHQLFQKAEDLVPKSLEWMTVDGAKAIQAMGWQEAALKQTLAHAIRSLGSRSLEIYVDALDECDDNQARGMVCFFEELCDLAEDLQIRLLICLSSRHYPHILIQKGLEVILEDETGHEEDMNRYIESKLRLGNSKQAQLLQKELLAKSSGIFLWLVLVIDTLNSEYPGKPIEKMQERLREMPHQLAALFKMILTRDKANSRELQLCLKWILFGGELTPAQLYFAIRFGLDGESLSGYWDRTILDADDMNNFVRVTSKGLAAVTESSGSLQVQFIHETVREFLLSSPETRASENFMDDAHDVLRDCCLAQINAAFNRDLANPVPLPWSYGRAIEPPEATRANFPFLSLSVDNILRYADRAQLHGKNQASFLEGFPLQRWRALVNVLSRSPRYPESDSLLHVLTVCGLAELIKVYPWADSCFGNTNLAGAPIFVALDDFDTSRGHRVVQALLEREVSCQQAESKFDGLLDEVRQRIRSTKPWKLPPLSWATRGLLSYLVGVGEEVFVAILLNPESGKACVNMEDDEGRTPLSYAASEGHEAIARLLIEKGADANRQDYRDETPLAHAISSGHEHIVRLFLDSGADLHLLGHSGKMPLLEAIRHGKESIVKLLVERGAEINPKPYSGITPLLILLESDIDFDDGVRERIARFLLEKGDKADLKNANAWKPLSLAVRYGYEDVAKLLLEKGAGVNSKDEFGRTPLAQLTLSVYKFQSCEWDLLPVPDGRREHIARLLLEKGAEIEVEDQDGQTPLMLAAKGGSADVVRVLLEKGAKVDAKDSQDRTALDCAIQVGHKNVVRLLLEAGAEDKRGAAAEALTQPICTPVVLRGIGGAFNWLGSD